MRRRIEFRLAAALMALATVFALAAGWMSYRHHLPDARDAAVGQALEIARTMNYAVETVASGTALERFVLTVAANPRIRAIALTSADGDRVVASSRLAWQGRSADDLGTTSIGRWLSHPLSGDSETRWRPGHGEAVAISRLWITDPVSPIAETLADGRVVVVMDASELIGRARKDALINAGWLTATVLAFTLLVFLLVRRELMAPINRVYQALKAQQAGESGRAAPETGSPEIRTLAQTVNEFFKLHQRIDRYRQVFEDLPVAVARIRIGNDGLHIDANPASRERLGIDVARITDLRTLQALFVDAGQRRALTRDLREHGMVRDREVLIAPGGDAPQRWIAMAAHLAHRGGDVVIDVVAEDITAHKEAMQGLNAERDRLRDIADSIPGAVYEYRLMPDGSERFPFVSDGLRTLLGLSPEERTDDPRILWSRVLPEDMEQMRTATRQANIGPPSDWHAEFRVRTGEGIHWLFGHAVPADDPGPGQLFRGVLIDITERKQLEARLERAARHDTLTGALNRAGFEPLLERAMATARRYDRPLSLLLADLDHFKAINDRFGHEMGDRVLAHFAEVMGGRLRDSDTFVRWGGEEFIILLPETGADGAWRIAETLRQTVAESAFPTGERLTVSLGVATLRPGDTVKALIRRADAGAYRAKRAGRNRVGAPPSGIAATGTSAH